MSTHKYLDRICRLFDTAAVHTIDIVMDDWEGFLDTCTNEEYALCDLVIDNEACKNVGIRAKGNTSLTPVRQRPVQLQDRVRPLRQHQDLLRP